MKIYCAYLIALLVSAFATGSHAMDEGTLSCAQQDFEFGVLPSDISAMILDKLTPKSGGYVYRYTQEQGNELIAAFAALRRVCKNFNGFITLAKFAELFTHEELSYLYYNKICTDKIDTRWLSLIAHCVGPKIQCPSCLLSDWATAKDKKLPDNKIPCEYFLAQVIHDGKSEDTVLSVVKTLVDAGTQVTFSGIEIWDEWLHNCVAHGSPLYNAIDREFSSVVKFLIDRGACCVDQTWLDFYKSRKPKMYELLVQLQNQQNYHVSHHVAQGYCTFQ